LNGSEKGTRLPGRDPANRNQVICFQVVFISLLFVMVIVDITISILHPALPKNTIQTDEWERPHKNPKNPRKLLL
jgi:hypothetical protein